jgi:hypothetical protein
MSSPALIWVKPVYGRTIRDPNSHLLMPPEGQFVPAGEPHWLQLLRFGDIVEATPPADPLHATN